MSETQVSARFRRTLPLFTSRDRDVIQRLLHHAVEDFAYDHPDRKIARDLYHKIREGEAFRMSVGPDPDDGVLVVDPSLADIAADRIVERFIEEMATHDGEWELVANRLDDWWTEAETQADDIVVGFEYLH